MKIIIESYGIAQGPESNLYPDMVLRVGGEPVTVVGHEADGFKLKPEALEAAIANYRGLPLPMAEGEVVCECFGVTDLEIKRAIEENKLQTVEEITNFTKAGGGCGKCLDRLEEILRETRHEIRQIIPDKRPGRLTTIQKIKRISLVACGTSWHSALIGKHLLESIAGISTEVDYASEFRYRNPIIRETDLVIVISQSGETADTLAALKEAKDKGAKTLGIVNVVGSTITREVDSGIYLHVGPEIGVASTKAFTSQVLALSLLAYYIWQETGHQLDEKILQELQTLPKKISQALESDQEIIKLAK